MDEDTRESLYFAYAVIGAVAFTVALIAGLGIGIYCATTEISVWSSSKQGQAELARADWNRQIYVREAKAKQEGAISLAQAEINRAKGVAKANKIIGESLKDNEAYLRYLWIDSLQNEKNQVIYVPTEANLPILEASRISKKTAITINKTGE